MRGDPDGAAAWEGLLRDLHGGVQRESQAGQARTQASQASQASEVHKTVELFPASRVLDKKRESFFTLLAQERKFMHFYFFYSLYYERMLRILTEMNRATNGSRYVHLSKEIVSDDESFWSVQSSLNISMITLLLFKMC